MSGKLHAFFASFVGVVALDQLTKYLVRENIPVRSGGIVIIPNLLSISHAINKGAAFSFMADFQYRLPVFFGLTAVSAVVLGFGLRALRNDDRLLSGALGVLFAGVIGNAIDRLVAGQVTDMIMVYAGFEPAKTWFLTRYQTYIFPIFNVADSAIWVGVIGFVLGYYITVVRTPDEAAHVPDAGSSRPSLD
jgi:signal peptidase II